jgi:hypothetical protein
MNFTEQTPQNSTFAKIVTGCIIAVIMVLFGVLSSCKSNEKRQAKMYGKFDKLKRKADSDSVLKVVPSKWSLDNFPMKLTGTKTVYLPSKKVVTHDTITKTSIKNDTTYITKYVTKYSHSVDTLRTTDTILDNRPLTQLQHDYRQIDAKLIQAQGNEQIAKGRLQNRTNKMWWSIGLNIWWLLLIIIFILRKFGLLR